LCRIKPITSWVSIPEERMPWRQSSHAASHDVGVFDDRRIQCGIACNCWLAVSYVCVQIPLEDHSSFLRLSSCSINSELDLLESSFFLSCSFKARINKILDIFTFKIFLQQHKLSSSDYLGASSLPDSIQLVARETIERLIIF